MNDLRRERDELRSQIDASDRDGRVEPRKKSKSLATPSPDFMITDHQQTLLTPPNSVGRHPGVVMEVMADFGQTDFGQTDFGQFFDRLWPIVVLTAFGQTDIGQF